MIKNSLNLIISQSKDTYVVYMCMYVGVHVRMWGACVYVGGMCVCGGACVCGGHVCMWGYL